MNRTDIARLVTVASTVALYVGVCLAAFGGLGCAGQTRVADSVSTVESVQYERSARLAPAQGYATAYRNSVAHGFYDVAPLTDDEACAEVARAHGVHYCEGPFARGAGYSCVFARHNGAPITETECDELGAAERAEADFLDASNACSLRWY